MAPTKPAMTSNNGQVNPVVDPHARVAKKPTKKRPRKGKNGLLNASIPRKSGHLLEIAQQNSIQSPLLRLPGEIRNKIWKFAVGGHVIDIRSIQGRRGRFVSRAVFDTRPRGSRSYPFHYIYPAFQLPLVCRQTYVETSTYIYSHNTFHFLCYTTMRIWAKKLFSGQRALITSIDVPESFMDWYFDESCRFRETFGSLTRVGIEADGCEWVLSGLMVPGGTPGDRARIVRAIKQNEGEDIEVDWYEWLFEDD